jgi:arsenate reductase-like glutaredoxin family protein
MQIVFYLKSCSTNKKIMSQFDLSRWVLREIKSQPISLEELEAMHQLTQSYEVLFSKKSTQIKARAIDVKSLKEEDFKQLLLAHYSFLKRPVFMTENHIFIGNEKENLVNLQYFFSKL